MASSLSDGLADALADAAAVTGGVFTWQGDEYGCVLNAESNSVTASKALFTDGVYPEVGNVIRVAGKDRQITSVANAAMEFAPGGLIETGKTFVDDPNNPALAIVFDGFINR